MDKTEIQIHAASIEDIPACETLFLKVWETTHRVYTELIGEELHESFFGNWQTESIADFSG